MTGGGARPAVYRDYAVFGLRIRSNVELPELFPASGGAAPDVTIELGSVPVVTHGEADGLNQVNGEFVLVIPKVARYGIEAGKRITVDAEPGVPERNVRVFLLGSAFGVLLHQRGLLPLHANAIEIDGAAVAFMGPSGAGKSTLAAWFHDRGFRVIADDVCAVSHDFEGRPQAAPGLPRLRLWAEALELMGRSSHGLNRSVLNDDDDEKFDVPIDPASAARSQTAAVRDLFARPRRQILHRAAAGDRSRGGNLREHLPRRYLTRTSGQKEHWESASAARPRNAGVPGDPPMGSSSLDDSAHACFTTREAAEEPGTLRRDGKPARQS